MGTKMDVVSAEAIWQRVIEARNIENPVRGLGPYMTIEIAPGGTADGSQDGSKDEGPSHINGQSGSGGVSSEYIDEESDINTQQPQILDIIYRRSPLQPDIQQQCIDLLTENLGSIYEDDKESGPIMETATNAIEHEDARFLLVFNEATLVGYATFRFNVNDEGDPTEAVLYVYELQVAKDYQHRHGIGRRLMALMEVVGLRAKMKKVMVTVCKRNQRAYRFYTRRMSYERDIICQPADESRQPDYEILSKDLTNNV